MVEMVNDQKLGLSKKVAKLEAAENAFSVYAGIRRETMDKEKYGLTSAGKVEFRDAPSMRGFDRPSMRTGAVNQSDLKDRQQQCMATAAAATQAEAYSWLRDDPVDPTAGFGFQPSTGGFGGGKDCGESGGTAEMMGGLENGSSMSPLHASEGVVAQQEQMSSIPASLFAQLRATKIKEHIIREAIEKHGGGQNGLKAVLKAIMFWLVKKNCHAARSGSGDLCTSGSESCSPTLAEAIDRHPWSSHKETAAGNSLGFQCGAFGDISSDKPSDLTCMLEVTSSRDDSGSLGDLRIGCRRSSSGSGEYSEVLSPENSLQVILGESEGNGLLGRLRSCTSVPSQNNLSPLSSGAWTSAMGTSVFPREATTRSDIIRKRSPSPHLHDIAAADGHNVFQGNKIRRQSPATAGFSFPHAELPVYGAPTPSASETSGSLGVSGHMEANPFSVGGHFSFSTLSPPSVDSYPQDFTSFGCQMPLFVDENLGMGVAAQGCGLISRSGSLGYPLPPDNPGHRKKPGSKLGEPPKGSPAACTRLARKNRMDRTRKVSQVSRGGAETPPLSAGKSKEVCSSSGGRTARFQDSPAPHEPACTMKDRLDKDHLQFLLQKVLRPSDVGNLGRVVLPKKDAESHLPWLGAKEKYQFACEDYDTGDKMTFRYRFWPNNDSRMYVLENTGDFVRRHKLQESDRLLIYKDMQLGTYVIRAQKAGDCVEGLPSKLGSKEKEGELEVSSNPKSPPVSSSYGTASSDKDAESPDSIVCSGLECSEERPSSGLLSGTAMTQDDLLDFTHLPGVPMGGGTEGLVRFPSLESFDVESLELGPVTAGKGSASSLGAP